MKTKFKRSLQQKAHAFQRRDFKKAVIKMINEIKAAVKKKANVGQLSLEFNVLDYQRERLVASRYLRLHTDLSFRIEEVYDEMFDGSLVLQKTIVTIKWA